MVGPSRANKNKKQGPPIQNYFFNKKNPFETIKKFARKGYPSRLARPPNKASPPTRNYLPPGLPQKWHLTLLESSDNLAGRGPTTDDGRPTDRRPTFDDRLTDDRPIDDRRPRTDDRRPTADDRRPTTDRPTTDDRRPTTDDRPTDDRRIDESTTDDGRPTTDRPTTDRWAADDRRLTTDDRRATDRRPTTSDRRPTDRRPTDRPQVMTSDLKSSGPEDVGE
jgi:hypothetical protein